MPLGIGAACALDYMKGGDTEIVAPLFFSKLLLKHCQPLHLSCFLSS